MRRGSVWQLDGIPAVPTQNVARAKWREWLRESIGGSDIAGILGISPWTTPLSVYCDKVGLSPERDPSAAMEFGLRMEPTLRKWAEDALRARYGDERRVFASPYFYTHPQNPRFRANIDGVVVLDERVIAGLELKTVDRFAAKEWAEDMIPEYYEAQAQWYMGITGLDYWIFGALIGKKFELRVLHADDAQVNNMQMAASEFWNTHVEPRMMPDALGQDADLLLNLFAEHSEDIIQAAELEDTCGKYVGLGQDIAALTETRDVMKAQLEQRIGDAKGLQAGLYSASWSRYDRTSVDTTVLKAKYPEVYAAVKKTSRSGRLIVRGGKDE